MKPNIVWRQFEGIYPLYSAHPSTQDWIRLDRTGSDALGTDDRKAIFVCKLFEINFSTCISFLIAVEEKEYLSKDDAHLKLGQLQRVGEIYQ